MPSSMAAGPVQARVSVPADRRTGSAMAPVAGPTMIGQSAMICAESGLRLRKAGRVWRGMRAARSWGPPKRSLDIGGATLSFFANAAPLRRRTACLV